MTQTKSMLMRIYTDEAAMHGDEEAVHVVVGRARKAGLAGATVLRGRLGFASGSMVHRHYSLGIGDNPPMVIELVDREDRLRQFVPQLADMHGIGLITLGAVEILFAADHSRKREA